MAKASRKKFDSTKRYTPTVKTAIIEVTRKARETGKNWEAAFTAAKAAGYTGTVGGLEAMMRKVAKQQGRGPKKKAGGAKSKKAAGRAAKSIERPVGETRASYEAFVRGVIGERVGPLLDRTAAELRRLADQLASLKPR